MKLPSFLFLTFLAAACPVHAMDNVKPPTAPAPSAGWVFADGNGILNLDAGPLPMVVGQLEELAPLLIGPGGEKGTMPNIIFGPGAQDVVVPAELRLRQVSPVQALALVATAANCVLTPIYPPETTPAPNDPFQGASAPDKIIGYQISIIPNATTPHYPALAAVSLRKTPVASPPKASATPQPGGSGDFTSSLGGSPNPTVSKMAVPTPTKTSPASTQNRIDIVQPGPEIVFGTMTLNPDSPFVRVYALGPILRGKVGDDVKEMQTNLEVLVEQALQQAGFNHDSPNLSFHNASRALIVRATTAQQGIIDQIIRALKENADSEAGAPAFKP